MSRTGRFLSELRDRAESSGDDRMRAFALGATIAYSVELCGSSYTNSVVRSTYRNHWWRKRWINNFVDTWVYGFYGSGGAGKVRLPNRVPKPFYTTWPNVTESHLERRIELPGVSAEGFLDAVRDSVSLPSLLPQAFVDYWRESFHAVHGVGLAPGTTRVDDAAIQNAYAMAWLILWIQTSGEVVPSLPADQVNYPDACGARPEWVAADGSVVVNTAPGGVVSPPPADRDTDPSIAEIISGIVLAIIGVAALFANVAAGIATIIVAIGLIADGATDPDWGKLRCDVGWLNVYLANLTNAFHDLFKWSGLGFPYTMELTHDEIAFVQAGIASPAECALNTVQSPGPDRAFPASRWSSVLSNWAVVPAEPIEMPQQIGYPSKGATWPFHFVDGLQPNEPPASSPGNPNPPQPPPTQVNPVAANPGRPALVRDSNEFVARQSTLNLTTNRQLFGNAVDISLELIRNTRSDELLNWDLDSDPGVGTPTWRLPTPTSPRSSSVPE